MLGNIHSCNDHFNHFPLTCTHLSWVPLVPSLGSLSSMTMMGLVMPQPRPEKKELWLVSKGIGGTGNLYFALAAKNSWQLCSLYPARLFLVPQLAEQLYLPEQLWFHLEELQQLQGWFQQGDLLEFMTLCGGCYERNLA